MFRRPAWLAAKPQPIEAQVTSAVQPSAQSAAPASAEALLRRLEWVVLRRLDGLLQGDYRSLWRGAGLDLADLREYQLHDDVRHLDWNVTARLQTPYVRQFQEDRDLSAWLLLDLSPSLDFGSRISKRQIAHEFVACLARILTRHGNRVGAVLYGEQVEQVLPARASRAHVLHLLQSLQNRRARHFSGNFHEKSTQTKAAKAQTAAPTQTALADLLLAGERTIKRRSSIVVVSDFISTPGWQMPLARLARRHDVTVVRLTDDLDRQLPPLGLIALRDAETAQQLLVDTHDIRLQARYTALAQARETTLLEAFTQAGVDVLELDTEDDLLESLRRFVLLRKRLLAPLAKTA